MPEEMGYVRNSHVEVHFRGENGVIGLDLVRLERDF